jgi:hypothetical protein
MKDKDRKTPNGARGERSYQRPEIMSMSSTDLLELLGPAHGYGRSGGSGAGSSMGKEAGALGFNKG